MKNIEADTSMREAIAGPTGSEKENKPMGTVEENKKKK